MKHMIFPHKICDPIHGFIRFNEIEKELIDSIPFQRLRYLHQMGVAYLLYPGATHCRFQHSLGVMELASRIFDSITHAQNLYSQEIIPRDPNELEYYRQILRLAALCHDLGHLPFSHTAEKNLLPNIGHEGMTLRIIQDKVMQKIWNKLAFNAKKAEEDIAKISLGEREGVKPLSKFEKILSQVIMEDNFGADRIDYLLRDAYYTGVGYGHFDYRQLIDTLRILPECRLLGEIDRDKFSIGVSLSGIQSVESLWMARYLMYARVYHHPKARMYTYHMQRFMKTHYEKHGLPQTIELYLKEADYSILQALQLAVDDPALPGHEDAAALLNRKPTFKEIFLQKELEASKLNELKEKYKGQFYSEKSEETSAEDFFRHFTVIVENKNLIPSREASDFLNKIPLGTKRISLYVHPEIYDVIKNLRI